MYGTAMIESLPHSNFRFVDFNRNFTHDDLLAVVLRSTPQDPEGVIIECDLEYDSNLIDSHNMLPLAPEHIVCPDPSPSQRRYLNAMGRQPAAPGKKLIAHFNKRERYVVHGQTLALYMKLGMKVTKVHRAVAFAQRPWMKQFIEKNTLLRQQATNAFQKDHFKLLNNSLYDTANMK
jgi:hypothetical protein